MTIADVSIIRHNIATQAAPPFNWHIMLTWYNTISTTVSFPFDPLQALFGNNAAYHDIHHQQFGIKRNYSQPYFTHWDTLLKTRMTPEQVPERHREKYHAGPVKDLNDRLKLAAKQAENGTIIVESVSKEIKTE
jgi:sterol desaturase/sphingolipid hydroxylase (fatty acid hydroxylase superfamily)